VAVVICSDFGGWYGLDSANLVFIDSATARRECRVCQDRQNILTKLARSLNTSAYPNLAEETVYQIDQCGFEPRRTHHDTHGSYQWGACSKSSLALTSTYAG